MVALPLIAGAFAGLGLSSLFGDSKKGTTTTYHPYAYYQPTFAQQYQFSPQYAVQISSPGAQITKKDVLKAESELTPSYYQPQEQGKTEGTNLVTIAIIGAIALVGYGLITKK